MEIVYDRAKSGKDLEQILDLQKRNLFANVSEEERQQEGFVTVSHSLDLLEEMNEACPHIIAKHRDTVVAYALCMDPAFSQKIEVLKPMFAEIETVIPAAESYIVMGQICVDKDYRKKGIFRMLYKTMQEATADRYGRIITEVDARNERSLQAHYSVGFSDLKLYQADGRQWCLIQLQ
ncbi:GNAT family N-acetyltransferase [Poritiphilus flavus]|uniref:GNAT family N-acetyltransferase n=1 Tax=Poritiphilus flavus TaxID=2697053 RepID=A0A6L9ED90_9FLAO|nr:GNAT family N-acetyltransferase [Poritiphilus flavus]NAS12603.1 GNAT family N-acetyltransferase [Poritiphilus flavus]